SNHSVNRIACSRYDYCDGLIYIDIDKKSFETTKRLYVTGNFSKYIPFGAVRFETNSDDSEVMTLGFEKDGKTVMIIINPTASEKSYTLPENSLIAVTDETSNLAEYSADKNTDIKITPASVTTIVF
ncbi:MAG: glycoside hydrolase family 30 beta sandwich domain-containing protein, partial [Acutalibacteraceae bacterium]|nr:glycoside hydrolase family 30 beta sandwich domain-containing protein [Acutalibacteraceae bacterium]